MKKRRFFAVVMAAVMTLSMVACGEQTGNDVTPTTAPTTAPTEAPVVDTEPTTDPVAVQETSIDFEDGNYGFAMVRTKPRKADLSVISLAEFNGSKALLVENGAGGEEMHVGFDLDAMLGDKITEVRSISLTVGTEFPDGEFGAVSGFLYAFTGEKLTENKLQDWSVYMKNKNPKTVTFTMPEGVSFTAGNDNYISFAKITDAGMADNDAAPASFYIDDIRFFDANGNVLKADTTVVMEAPANFLAVVEEDETATNVVKVEGDAAYGGDWGQSSVVSADVLAQFAGQDVTLTAKFERTGDKDYYMWGPMDTSWVKLGADKIGLTVKTQDEAAAAGEKYFAQGDGQVNLFDLGNSEVTITLPAAVVDELIATGGFSAQTFGVIVYEIQLSSAAASVIKEKVEGDAAYGGDWGQSSVISAEILSKFAGKDVTLTAKFERTGDKDYYMWGPMDTSWVKLGADKIGLTVKTQDEATAAGEKYFVQGDGQVNLFDLDNSEVTIKLPAAVVDELIATGGFSAQTFGVIVYELVLEAEATAESVKEKVAADEAYAGDWQASGLIPADVLSKFAGMDVELTAKFELTGDKAYYLWGPMDSTGNKLTGDRYSVADETGAQYYIQADGFTVLADWTITEITLNLPAAYIDEMIESGQGFYALTHGVIAYELVLKGTPAKSAPATDAPVTDTPATEEPATEEPAGNEIVFEGGKAIVPCESEFVGDWNNQSSNIPADVFAKFAGKEVTLTVKFDVTGDRDYYIWAPIDVNWTKLGGKLGVPVKTPEDAAAAGDKIFAKDDDVIQILDTAMQEFTVTLPAELVDELAANGGLAAMVYGVIVKEIVVAANVMTEDGKAVIPCESEFVGDWNNQSSNVSADVFAKFAGKDVKVTVKFDVTGDRDYYIWAPIDVNWTKLGGRLGVPVKTPEDAAAAGDKFFAKDDDVIQILDVTMQEFTVTFPAALVDELAANGGLAAMVYGVIVKEIVLEAAN